MISSVKDFLRKIFGGSVSDPSGSTAVSRMRLMLTHDRHEVSPGLMTQMKQEILAVISKYFDVNENVFSLNGLDQAIDKAKNECINIVNRRKIKIIFKYNSQLF